MFMNLKGSKTEKNLETALQCEALEECPICKHPQKYFTKI